MKIEQKGLLFSFGEQKFEFLGRVPNFPYSFFQIESNFRLREKVKEQNDEPNFTICTEA